MDLILFTLRHTPWWSVPLMIIGGQFGYMFWLKDRLPASVAFSSVAFFGLIATLYYIYAGGPESTPQHFQQFILGK